MPTWMSYSLSDLLLFSPRTYYRLFELMNAALWPAHVPLLAAALAVAVLALAGHRRAGRGAAALLAAAWAWTAVDFLAIRYAAVNWAAPWFAGAFLAQAALLAWQGLFRDRLQPAPGGRAGTALYLAAVLLMPLAAPLSGRLWTQAEPFGLAPDPTAAATLGLLAAARAPWSLWIVPLLWCAVSGATLRTMEAPDFWVLPTIGLLALALRLRRHPV